MEVRVESSLSVLQDLSSAVTAVLMDLWSEELKDSVPLKADSKRWEHTNVLVS
jgi:hypothetical protein